MIKGEMTETELGTEIIGIAITIEIVITEIKIVVIAGANTLALALAHRANPTDIDTIEIVKTTDVEIPAVLQRKEAATITLLAIADIDHDISLPTY